MSCDEEEQEGSDPRTLRGGSYFYDEDNVRCAYRVRLNPYNVFRLDGFRVVVRSPGS